MPEKTIPYGRQSLDDDDISAVVDVLRGDFLTTGPAVERFEKALTDFTGSNHALVLNSGTSALHAAYFACGIGPGDEVITSPLTFAATANAALYLGATVKFVDVDPATGNLDPALVAQAITDRTKLIVPVDYAGHPADYDPILALARPKGIRVVADGAHSLGATYHGRKVGTLADLTELSFHPVKPVTTAEGGAVTTEAPDLARRVARFRTHGITREPSELRKSEGPWYYEMQDLGFNYRLTDVQCALGWSQMRKLEGFIARRRAIAARYNEAFQATNSLITPTVLPGVEPGWHLYVLRVAGNPASRRPFFERLRAEGLGVQVHYLPVHLHPYYQELGFKPGICPNAEEFYARAVSIPIFPRMTDEDVSRVIDCIGRVAREVLE